jgi:hypothetical protein
VVILIELPILIALILLSISIYIGSLIIKASEDGSILSFGAGILNGIVISILNFIYRFLVIYFAKNYENHKYQSMFEAS